MITISRAHSELFLPTATENQKILPFFRQVIRDKNSSELLHQVAREIIVPSLLTLRQLFSVPHPAWITLSKGPQNVASTNFVTTQVTASQLTLIWSLNLVQPWSCLGAPSIAHCPLSRGHYSRSTLQWTRIDITGIYTALVWHEWDPCRVTPLTGEQYAVTKLTAWISPTTFAERLKTPTSPIKVWLTYAREWNTSTSGDTL